MSYIDTKYLFKCETCHMRIDGKCNAWCESGEAYSPDMSKIPTADVVEVVRCEKCLHGRPIDNTKSPEKYFKDDCVVCECEDVVGDEPMIYPPTHYCSYGKRKPQKIEVDPQHSKELNKEMVMNVTGGHNLMDLREKLIGIVCDAMEADGCIGHCNHSPCFAVERVVNALIENGTTVQEWIPVSEPPKDDPTAYVYQSVSIALKTGKVVSGFYRHDTKEWWGDVADGEYGIVTDLVTHWMPLSKPPEPQKGE